MNPLIFSFSHFSDKTPFRGVYNLNASMLLYLFSARISTFNVPHLPAPPMPPENIISEQDRQVQLQYEQWMNHQNSILTQQLKYYETEVQKLRKAKKVCS